MTSRHHQVMGLVLALAACGRVGAPAPAPVAGVEEPVASMTSTSLSGVATLGGQRLRLIVDLTTDDRGKGTGHLEIPDLTLSADGAAQWRGDSLELDLRYDGDCPGVLRIRAQRMPDGGRLEGTLSAKDCTGEESGAVVLEAATSRSGTLPVPTPR